MKEKFISLISLCDKAKLKDRDKDEEETIWKIHPARAVKEYSSIIETTIIELNKELEKKTTEIDNSTKILARSIERDQSNTYTGDLVSACNQVSKTIDTAAGILACALEDNDIFICDLVSTCYKVSEAIKAMETGQIHTLIEHDDDSNTNPFSYIRNHLEKT